MKKLLALFLFDIGTLLQILGTPSGQRSVEAARRIKAERLRLIAAFDHPDINDVQPIKATLDDLNDPLGERFRNN